MKGSLLKLCYIFILLTVLQSCLNIQDRIEFFINDYNKSAVIFEKKSNVKIKTEKINSKEIKITFKKDHETNSINNQMDKKIFEGYFKQIIYGKDYVKEMVEDGIKFDFYVIDKNGKLIFNKAYDLSNYDKNEKYQIKKGIDYKDMELIEYMQHLNRPLPVTDSINNFKTLKFQLLSDTEIELTFEFPDEDVDLFINNREVVLMFRRDVLNDKYQKALVNEFFNKGIKKFYFSFKNKNKTKNKSIVFTKDDFN